MPCCKAEKYKWCSSFDTVTYYDGKEYCTFHAPEGQRGMSTEKFNELVLKRIQRSKDSNKKCDLSGTIFDGPIDFSQYDQRGSLPSINFQEVTFSADANFRDVTFNEEVSFDKALFKGSSSFWCVSFRGQVSFSEAKFLKNASWGETKFDREATFQLATFAEGAYFSNTTFKDSVNFRIFQMGSDQAN